MIRLLSRTWRHRCRCPRSFARSLNQMSWTALTASSWRPARLHICVGQPHPQNRRPGQRRRPRTACERWLRPHGVPYWPICVLCGRSQCHTLMKGSRFDRHVDEPNTCFMTEEPELSCRSRCPHKARPDGSRSAGHDRHKRPSVATGRTRSTTAAGCCAAASPTSDQRQWTRLE